MILNELFNRFNFTVTESTPLDVEVAVDPEMLGRVFEELVTGRHETGSYYTPKPVVSFMCREALKGHLGTRLPHDSPETIRRFVEDYDPVDLRDPEAAITNQKCFIITNVDKFLLGVLNSSAVWELLLLSSPGLRGGFAEPRRGFMLSLPIPDAPATDRDAIAGLAQKCLDAKGVGCEEW